MDTIKESKGNLNIGFGIIVTSDGGSSGMDLWGGL